MKKQEIVGGRGPFLFMLLYLLFYSVYLLYYHFKFVVLACRAAGSGGAIYTWNPGGTPWLPAFNNYWLQFVFF